MKLKTAIKNLRSEYFIEEFKKYISLMTGGRELVETEFSPKISGEIESGVIKLGFLSDFGLPDDDLNDPFAEDILDIDICRGTGYIAGSNERSILMGIYKFFTSAGCRFIRPGRDGEYIPECDIANHSFRYRKKADNLFRGECCEGAISYEHMRDTVYWLPKVGMNMYMIEGIVPYNYMHKWYGHVGNTVLHQKGYVTDYGFLENLIARLEKDIEKTGIQFHAMGHGWMFEKFGIRHCHEDSQKPIPEKFKKYLALVNGKRDLMYGDTFYTHFCYSNPEGRKLLADFVIEYLQKKPYIDFMHVWLADASDNICECDECKKTTPSDQYVELLNEIDERLTALGSNQRIVFILYVETVRPPVLKKLKNPSRFIILAAIGLHYQKGYINEEYRGEIPPFVRNRFTPPPNALRLSWHREWKRLCGNIPSCIYEYRFYTDQYCDPGYMQIARETFRDMKALESVSFQGCMSDQTHRNTFPTSLPMVLMGETLFDTSLNYEEFVRDYFMTAYGEDGSLCREYLETLSDLFCPQSLRQEGKNGVEEEGLETNENAFLSWKNNPEVAEKLRKIPQVIEDFMPVIIKNMGSSDRCRMRSWELLRFHAEFACRLSEAYGAGAEGDMKKARKIYLKLIDDISSKELEIDDSFDLFLFDKYTRAKFDLEPVEYFI